MTTRIGFFLFAALWCAAPSLTGAAEPMPPSSVCIDNTQCVSTTTVNTSTSAAIKWNPGYYMQVLRGSAEQSQSYRFSLYESIGNNSAVEGVVWNPRWKDLEGDSRGNYSAGFALVRSEINKLKSLPVPKRLIIRINDLGYGASYPATGYYPSYLQASCLYDTASNYQVTTWKKWTSTCMDYYIAMLEAYAKEFDSEPYVEGIILYRESAQQFGGVTPPGYTISAFDTQHRRMALAAKKAWKTTNVLAGVNYFGAGSVSATNEHIAYLASIGVGNMNADTCPDCKIWADLTIQGINGGKDYRGQMPVWQGAEVSEMGINSVGPDGGYTATQLANFANNTMRASHILWDYNNYAGTSAQQWATGLLPYINANPKPTYTSCPKVYASCKAQ